PTPTLIAESTPLPPPEGTLRVGVTGAAPHKDMHAMVSEWAALFGPGPSHGRLMRFTLHEGVPPTLAVECDLCESWRFVDDLTAEFTLRRDAHWQPAEGFASRPVTPQDVVFSMERLRTPGLPHRSLLDSVDSVEAVNEEVVRFRLRYSDPDLPTKLASPYAVLLAPESLDGVDVQRSDVPGAGPWLYERGITGQVTLTAWDGHNTGTNVQRIVFHPASNADVVTHLLRQGRVDLAQVSESDWPELEAEGFSSEVVHRSGRGVLFGLNSARPPFDDRSVRRAAFLALSPGDALRAAFGIGSVSTGLPLAAGAWALPQEEIDAPFGNPAQARAMLADPGAPGPVTLTVANFGETYIEHGRLLAEQLEEAGFEVTVEVLSRATYLRRVWQERDFDAFVGPMPPTDTPNAFLLGLVHSGSAFNVTGGAASLDALIEQQSRELDGAARAGLAQALQREMLSEALFFMAAGAAERWAFSDRVEGFVPHMPMGSGGLWALVSVSDAGTG
ncbi:MAG: ABC transporter substrate-binding protein, partial [Chloroflexi bacterium]|nr:ABC transporter substrate-binding protein [Chloroflexota bacterium]